MRIKLLKANWKRWLIIITCIVLVVVQQIWPHIQFSIFSIGLLITATIFLVSPNLYVIFPYIKRVKLWEAELELQERVEELSKDVNKAKKDAVTNIDSTSIKSISLKSYIKDIFYYMPNDATTSLVLITTKIDRLIRDIIFKKHGHPIEKPVVYKIVYKNTMRTIYVDGDILLVNQYIPPSILQSISDFLNAKHIFTRQPTSNTATANHLIATGVELLILVAEEENNTPSKS